MFNKKAFGAWSELSGWILILIVMVILIIIIATASGYLDISFLKALGG